MKYISIKCVWLVYRDSLHIVHRYTEISIVTCTARNRKKLNGTVTSSAL